MAAGAACITCVVFTLSVLAFRATAQTGTSTPPNQCTPTTTTQTTKRGDQQAAGGLAGAVGLDACLPQIFVTTTTIKSGAGGDGLACTVTTTTSSTQAPGPLYANS